MEPFWLADYERMKVRAETAEAQLTALQAEQAQWQQPLIEEIDCLCQAIEGHRCGSLTNDGLWHYWTKAKKLLAALTAQQETE